MYSRIPHDQGSWLEFAETCRLIHQTVLTIKSMLCVSVDCSYICTVSLFNGHEL